MMKVPHLVENRAAVVVGALACLSLVVLGSTAADEGQLAKAIGQGILDVRDTVLSSVRGVNIRSGEPAPGRQLTIEGDGSFEEVPQIIELMCVGTLRMERVRSLILYMWSRNYNIHSTPFGTWSSK